MNELIFYVGFSSITTLLFLPAIWAKFAFSDNNFTLIKLSIAMIYNFIFAIIYWRYADEGYLPFIGIKDDPLMRTLSVIISLTYLYAIPTPWKSERPFFMKKRTNMNTHDKKIRIEDITPNTDKHI